MSSPPSSLKSRQSHSYFYPIKSLLSGRIQPAVDLSPRADDPSSSDLDLAQRQPLKSGSQATRHRVKLSTKDEQLMFGQEGNNNSVSSSPQASSSRQLRRAKSDSQTIYDESASPNFQHFPAEQNNSDRPRLFRSASVLMSDPASSPLSSIATISAGSGGVASVTCNGLLSSGTDWDKSLPVPCASVDVSLTLTGAPPLDPAAVSTDLYFNPSEYGIVHLAHVPVINKLSAPDPSSSLGHSKSSSYRSNSPLNRPTSQSRIASSPSISSRSLDTTVSELSLESLGSMGSADPLVTFRFQHAEDEHGNHVVIGREGKLERCEDEVGSLHISALDSYL
jgi:hypothetical protein